MISRSHFILTLAAAFTFAMSPAYADKGHDHKHDHGKGGDHAHDHAGHDHGGAHDHPVMSSHDGMVALYKHLAEMETELAAGTLDGVHGHDEAIQAAVKGLHKDTTLTEAKRKKVQGYAKNVQKISGKMHGAADAKNLDQARKELAKLKAQIDLLDKQFGHSHKPAGAGNSKGHHHAHPPAGK
jgi:hypothetical protein